MLKCKEYQVISFNIMQMFNKIPSLHFILHDYLWRINTFPSKNIFMNILPVSYWYMYFQRNLK